MQFDRDAINAMSQRYRAHFIKGTSINPELPLAFRASRDQGGFATSGWLPAE
ncbi:hypothetical protein [Gilvimarinus xylanilyticus]|uniref:Uncharacterized protein n=1 Tax=Gilvimarinus xylanilyticus TaxID=2944139 RepID=A0A9X2I4R8_9GAMM|nr:hypothetical protein [Gilvimarinus xylanilyticus]MCP8900335.1 hypothetical protein [Gilvimarinus xylanilyticus]